MIIMLFYSHIKNELKVMKEQGFEVTCKLSDDDWDFFTFDERNKLSEFLEENPIVDISIVDVEADNGVEIAETLRTKNKNTYIIILANSDTSPTKYLRPSIKAGSLLLRPLTEANIKQIFFEALKEYMRLFESVSKEDSFVIDNRDGRQLIPYEQIVYFESREKKIILNTGICEYSFYDTLDNLEKILGDGFVRCHRSFIVKKSRIDKIMLSKNIILLSDGYSVPLSRSYKGAIKGIR